MINKNIQGLVRDKKKHEWKKYTNEPEIEREKHAHKWTGIVRQLFTLIEMILGQFDISVDQCAIDSSPAIFYHLNFVLFFSVFFVGTKSVVLRFHRVYTQNNDWMMPSTFKGWHNKRANRTSTAPIFQSGYFLPKRMRKTDIAVTLAFI